jgi:hypothetical protein
MAIGQKLQILQCVMFLFSSNIGGKTVCDLNMYELFMLTFMFINNNLCRIEWAGFHFFGLF